MEVINVTEQLGGMNFNRPMTAMSSKEKKTLGSTCPVIIKHEFPNEQKHYIDNVGQEMSSTKKRFIYDRPNTAKIQQNSIAQQNQQSQGWGLKRSSSGQGLQLPNSANGMKRNSASALSQASYQINSADLYNKLLEGQRIKKENRFVIKPARKLNTFQIHSALFKIKKQKEELDYKIRELEDLKSNFNEMDFYLIANSGAVDYMFNAGAISQANVPSNYGGQGESGEINEETDNMIPSLANIHSQSESNLKKDFVKQNALSSSKKISVSKLTQKQPRPQTSVPQANDQKSFKKVRAATAKANSRDQIEMLRGESRDESGDKGIDLEILGNCMKIFQDEERLQVHEWGKNMDNSDQVKDNIEQIGQGLPTINRLLSAKNAAGFHPEFGEIKEEEEKEELQIQPFESLQRHLYEQDYQQFLNIDQTNNLQTNSPYSDNQQQLRIGDPQYNLQQYASTQEGSMQGVISPNSQQQEGQNVKQYEFQNGFPNRQQKQKNSKRIHSATSQHGLFRPQSSSINSVINSNLYSMTPNAQNRPLTATSSSKFFGKGGHASHHALMSYGPVLIVKEQITRNYDHLEILAETKNMERQKKQKQREKIENQLDQLGLKVAGTRLPINTDTFADLQFKTKQALANINNYSGVQQVDLNGGFNQQNFFQNSVPFTESHFFSAPNNSQQNKPAQLNRVFSPGQLQIQQNQNMTPQQVQQAINYQNFQQLHSVSQVTTVQQDSQSNRAAIDLLQMQKDQSIKFMRPSTAKPGSSQSSRLQNQNGQSNSSNSNPLSHINVPIAESFAFKGNQQQSVNQNGHDNLSGVVFANASVNLNLMQSNPASSDSNKNENDNKQQMIPITLSNDNVQQFLSIQSNQVGEINQSTLQQSLQNPPNLQQYQVIGQQEFQFGSINSENKSPLNNAQINNGTEFPDDLTVKKKNRPQTAIKKQ